MSTRANLNRNHWNDSMHIFFSPKLSLEGRNLLPQIIDPSFGHRDQNFLTVFKKPIVNIYDKISIKKQKRPAVLIVGQAKEVEKRTQTTQNKRRHISAELQQQFIKNYRETINQVHELQKPYKRKGISYNKIDITKQKQQKQKYYYYIGPGNNSQLVQQILSKRTNWAPTSSSLYHLRWQQYRPKYQNNAINKQLFNHLPNHQVISDKVGLVNSLRNYCEKNQEQMFSIMPTCFYFDFGNLESCESEIKRFIEFYFDETERIAKIGDPVEDDKLIKSVCSSPKKTISKTQSSKASNISTQSPNRTNFRTKKPHQSISPSVQENTKRKQQIKQLHKILLSKLKTHYNFVDMSAPRKQSQFLTPIHYQVYGSTCLWLLKPADLNRGRGIHLFRSIQELGDLLKLELSRHQKGSFLVQKYIQKPMLIDSRKFDIRVYSLITQNKQVYFFKEGYIRTSSVTFDVSSTNYFTHLTNNAIQKHSKTYGQFEQGNILPLNYLFREHGLDKKSIYSQIKRMIQICTKASFPKIFTFPQKLPNVTSSPTITQTHSNMGKMKYFQIFGYDFMLDETGHVWLIQVNTNPCIQLSNQWLKAIIPRMLDDAFKLTVDRMFLKGKDGKDAKESKENTERGTVYSVPQYSDDEIMWEYLDLRTQAASSPVISRIG